MPRSVRDLDLLNSLKPLLGSVLQFLSGRGSGARPAGRGEAAKLGTFLGVFTPTVLTILGVIMYLRFGWVVGHVGLIRTLAIVVLANLITFITSLSLSAIATNTRVGVGGAYYMISRSLGLEVGGAIGLPLFLSQAFSVTLYSFGLAESLRFVWSGVPVAPTAFLIILAVAGLSYRGAGAALRSQVPIMGLIGVSLVMLTLGAVFGGSVSNLTHSGLSGQVGFWAAFAVFFPAVTGIMAGLGLSGDLEDPRKSIPVGTLGAMFMGFAVYLVVPILLVYGASPESLRDNPLVWTEVAVFGPLLVFPGLWGAIFSSAVGSMLGAPRTLQAMAMDRLAPARFAASGKNGEQKPAGLIVSAGIALGAVFLGDLNTVAVVVSMFFLTVYGTVNLAAAVESLSGAPSWRPTVPVHWSLSLLGAAGCFGVMLLINPMASVVAVAVELALWLFLHRRERRADWGDVRGGMYEAIVRWALLKLSRRPVTARNWRPHILVFAEHAERRLDLVRYASWFTQDRGIVTVCELVVGDLLDMEVDPMERQLRLGEMLRREGLVAFPEMNVVRNVEDGIVAVAQANGMAGVESNTMLLGLPEDAERLAVLLRVIRRLERLHKSLIIGRVRPLPPLRAGKRRSVHVWWGGLQRNGDLMLLLAYLLTRNPEWRSAEVRVLSIASNQLMKDNTERFLRGLLPEIRIEGEVEVLVKVEGVPVQGLIQTKSQGADLVLLGMATPEEGGEEAYAERLLEMAEALPSVFFVRNASLFIGELVSGEQDLGGGKVPLPRDVKPPEAEAEQQV